MIERKFFVIKPDCSNRTIEWNGYGASRERYFCPTFLRHHQKAHPGLLFAHIAGRILTDEARHLAFAELYLKAALARSPKLKPVFLKMRDELLVLVREIYLGVKEKSDVHRSG